MHRMLIALREVHFLNPSKLSTMTKFQLPGEKKKEKLR